MVGFQGSVLQLLTFLKWFLVAKVYWEVARMMQAYDGILTH